MKIVDAAFVVVYVQANKSISGGWAMKMTKTALIAMLLMTTVCLNAAGDMQMSQGMEGMGRGMGNAMRGGAIIEVPEKLPAPKNAEWVKSLQEVLDLEKQSNAQYTADRDKYNATMPYNMIISQEHEHIKAIEKLFSAYGIKASEKPAKAVETKSLKDAYELCIKMEQNLIKRYEWLVKNAQDQETASVLNSILLQTRWHLAMFEHALSMGGCPGMMGPSTMRPGMGD